MKKYTCANTDENGVGNMNELKKIFNKANNRFLAAELSLIKSDVSERCICGALKSYLEKEIERTKYSDYHVDVEYNRNAGRIKTIIDENEEIINITCDIIIHSRGEIEQNDNLIAIEMKKSYQSEESKNDDRKRLRALTKSKNNKETYSYDGKTFPRHVCGYRLGVYYEIDAENEKIIIEYYARGSFVEKYEKLFKNVYKKRRLP